MMSDHNVVLKKMKKANYIFPIAVIMLLPLVASANAGTPLMWASILHLAFGNAMIGLFEGWLLAWIFKCSKKKSIPILIGANYASAWAGGFLVSWPISSIPDITIESIRLWFIILVLVAFLITLFIELPFFWVALRSKKNPLWQAIKATLLIHSISYTLLFGWYWMASGTSMMTQLQVVSPGHFQTTGLYSLYFISPEGDKVIKSDIKGNRKTVLRKISAPHRNDRLFVRPNADNGYDLFIYLDSEQKEELISEDFSPHAPVEWRITKGNSKKAAGTWFNFGRVPCLADESDWDFYTGFWAVQGIRGSSKTESKSFHFSLETPFASWIARNATHLQRDVVVFQLGGDQICILHPESKKIALIARGKGPIVAERLFQSNKRKNKETGDLQNHR
jgi:hypothetical protein